MGGGKRRYSCRRANTKIRDIARVHAHAKMQTSPFTSQNVQKAGLQTHTRVTLNTSEGAYPFSSFAFSTVTVFVCVCLFVCVRVCVCVAGKRVISSLMRENTNHISH